MGAEHALARARAYGLLGGLFSRGPADHRELLGAVPGLAEHLPADPDIAAAEHHALFRRELFPNQSVFVSDEGLMGGPAASTVREAMRASGYRPADLDEPDQLGAELSWLAFLGAAEADALRDGVDPSSIHLHQSTALVELRSWLAPFVVALGGQHADLYQIAADWVVELVSDHADQIGVVDRLELPRLREDLLDDPKTGLARIARVLTTPALCGGFLTRADFRRLGGGQLPGGFGSRMRTLESVFHTAVRYGELDRVLAALQVLLRSWDAQYAALGERGLPVVAWRLRVGEMRGVVARMLEAVEAG